MRRDCIRTGFPFFRDFVCGCNLALSLMISTYTWEFMFWKIHDWSIPKKQSSAYRRALTEASRVMKKTLVDRLNVDYYEILYCNDQSPVFEKTYQ